MQLYQVTDREGDLIMNAPIETIAKVFAINSVALSHIISHTQRLGHTYWLHRVQTNGWPETLLIERLPLEVPLSACAVEMWDEPAIAEFLSRSNTITQD